MTKGENEVCSEIKGISSDLQMITHIVSFVNLCAHVYECVCVHVGVVCRYMCIFVNTRVQPFLSFVLFYFYFIFFARSLNGLKLTEPAGLVGH